MPSSTPHSLSIITSATPTTNTTPTITFNNLTTGTIPGNHAPPNSPSFHPTPAEQQDDALALSFIERLITKMIWDEAVAAIVGGTGVHHVGGQEPEEPEEMEMDEETMKEFEELRRLSGLMGPPVGCASGDEIEVSVTCRCQCEYEDEDEVRCVGGTEEEEDEGEMPVDGETLKELEELRELDEEEGEDEMDAEEMDAETLTELEELRRLSESMGPGEEGDQVEVQCRCECEMAVEGNGVRWDAWGWVDGGLAW